MSLLAAYWDAIGFKAEIDVMERGAYRSAWYAHSYDTAFSAWGNTAPYTAFKWAYRPGHMYNFSIVDEPFLNEQLEKAINTTDEVEEKKIMKELGVWAKRMCHQIEFPAPYAFMLWQPWFKGYDGQYQYSANFNEQGFLQFIWLDLDLKESIAKTR